MLPCSQQGLVSRSHLETLAQLRGLAKGRDQNVGPVAIDETMWPWGRLQWRTRGGPGSDTALLDRHPCCLPMGEPEPHSSRDLSSLSQKEEEEALFCPGSRPPLSRFSAPGLGICDSRWPAAAS